MLKIRIPVPSPKLEEVQIKALNRALKLHELSTDKDKLYCPFCGDPLILGKVDRFESLEEHVSGIDPCPKQGYTCDCKIGSHFHWTSDGESYKDYTISSEDFDNVISKLLTSALNSSTKSAEVGIYKLSVPSESKTLYFRNYGIFLSRSYEVDKFGIPTKCWIEPRLVIRESDNMYRYGSWWIDTWRFLYSRFKNHVKNYRRLKSKKSTVACNRMLRNMFALPMNSAFPYRVFDRFKKIWWRKEYKDFLNLKEELE